MARETEGSGGSSTAAGRGRGLTIRGRIFAAFALIVVITGLLGLYAVAGMTQAGHLVVRTFDMPLMAINHARLAKSNFTELRLLMLRRHVGGSALASGSSAADIKKQLDDVSEDLDIAGRRSLSRQGVETAAELKRLVGAWYAEHPTDGSAPDWSRLDALAAGIERKFGVLINTAAGDAFIWRQDAIATIESNRLLHIAGVLAALLLAAAVTLALARQILRPIRAASSAAERIAGGELETPIPAAGRDETGALLAAMAVMQENLRAMMAREIAERRSAQRRLVEAIESLREGVVLVGADGNILVANSEAGCLFPAARSLLTPGRPFAAFLDRIRAHGLARTAEGEGGPPMTDGELALADGRWLRISRSGVADGGFVLVWSDISLLKDREATLRAAKDAAVAADRSKTQFLTNMSHELRTPLNAIIGFSEMISHEVAGPVGASQYKAYAGDIIDSGRHLLAIITDILDIAKSQAGKLHIEARRVDVATLFEECGKIIGHGCTRAKLTFERRTPPPGLAIHADPVKTRQILLNLLSNAIKFTPAGGTIRLWAEEHSSDFAELVVADSGIGMRAEDIPVAMAPFAQIDSRLARKYEGTGLGLPLTKILTELQGGALALSSEPAKGTTVRVRLPRPPRTARETTRTALRAA